MAKKNKNGKSKRWTCRVGPDGVRHPAVEVAWEGDCSVCGRSRPLGGNNQRRILDGAADAAEAATAIHIAAKPLELDFPEKSGMWFCSGGNDDLHEPVEVQREGREACMLCGRIIPDSPPRQSEVVAVSAGEQQKEVSCQGAESAVKTALEHAGNAEAHTRRSVASAMRSAERADAAEEAARKAETAVSDAVEAATIARNAEESAAGAAKCVAVDAKRTDELQRLAHASAEAADTHAQKAGVEAGRAKDARDAAEKTARALARRKWTAWAWPLALVIACVAVFAITLYRIPVLSDVKSAVQAELDERGAVAALTPPVQSVVAPPVVVDAVDPAEPVAVEVAEPASTVQVPSPVLETPALKVQEQEPPLVSTPVPPPASSVAPQPQIEAPVRPVAPAHVAPTPAVVLAQPASTVVANQVSVPVQHHANECEACVTKMRAPPLRFAEQDARAGCAFLCGGR